MMSILEAWDMACEETRRDFWPQMAFVFGSLVVLGMVISAVSAVIG